MNETLKNYLISSGITFVGAFALAIVTQLDSGALTSATLTTSTVFAVFSAAMRAAVKALAETVVIPATAKAGKAIRAGFAGPAPVAKKVSAKKRK